MIHHARGWLCSTWGWRGARPNSPNSSPAQQVAASVRRWLVDVRTIDPDGGAAKALRIARRPVRSVSPPAWITATRDSKSAERQAPKSPIAFRGTDRAYQQGAEVRPGCLEAREAREATARPTSRQWPDGSGPRCKASATARLTAKVDQAPRIVMRDADAVFGLLEELAESRGHRMATGAHRTAPLPRAPAIRSQISGGFRRADAR
jgi:hypothetical protein